MPTYLAAIDLQKNELRNARIQNLALAPSAPVEGQIYYNTVDHLLYTFDGTDWQAGSGATGVAGGDLSGTYPNPSIADDVIDDANISATAAIALSKLAVNPLDRLNHTGTQLAATISDFDAQVATSTLDELGDAAANVSLGGFALTNLLNPVDPQDGATKAYVDAASLGLDVKQSVRAASTADVSLSGTQTIDGVTLVDGDRFLVKDNTDDTENGIYVVAAGAWARSGDADANADVSPGMFTFVEEGTAHADSGWILTTDGTVDLGVTALAFTQFSGAGQLSAGAGLTKTGTVVDVIGTTDRITVTADAVDISTNYAGQASIVTLGTVTTGTWEATVIDVAHGGTGAATADAGRAALGAIGTYTALNGGTATDVVVHGLNTLDVSTTLRFVADGSPVFADVYVTDVNTVTVQYGAAVSAGTLAITVHG